MTQQKKDGQPGSQFDSGFGGSMFGGGSGAGQFGAGQTSQGGGAPGGNSQFGGGEFASGFGSTNAVSQIFKEGGFAGDDRKKKMLIFGSVAAVALCLGAVYFLFMDDTSSMDTPAPTEAVAPTEAAAPAAAAAEGEDAAAEGEDEAAEGDEVVEDAAATAAAPAPAAAAPAEAAPGVTGMTSTYDYNEEVGGPVVSGNPGSILEVARRADFSDAYVIGKVGASGQFRIPNPPPGAVYWREQGTQGSNQITVSAPPALGLSFSAPASVAEGTQISWSASGPVAFYRLEFATDESFGSLSHVISTSQTAVSVTGVVAGTYYLRLSGFNRASGKWEHSSGSQVQVQ